MQSLWTKYQGHGVQMVAVHVNQNQAAAQTWLAGMGITFPVVQDDASLTIFGKYATGTNGVPQLYIINRQQVIHSSHLGEEQESIIEGHILDAIYVRNAVDIEMVMDVSDTMNYAPTSGDTRLTMMRQAAKMIMDFLCDHGQSGDRVGLVWFTDNASEYVDAGGQKLIPVVSSWLDLKNRIDAQGTGICTAMGGGLKTAFNTLTSSTQGRFVILLTDGMQNIEPKVTKVGSHYEIIDSGGWLCGAHSNVAAQPGVDISTYQAHVHTIGVGVTANYASLLQDVANELDGLYLGTDDPAVDLNLIYFVDLCNCLAGSSPAVVHHHAGIFYPQECQAVETFQLNCSVRKITAILSWEKSLVGSLTFWLRAPDGTLLDLHQEIKLYDAYAMATIYLPKEHGGKRLSHVGEWQMIVRGETGGTVAAYQALVIAEDPETRFLFDYAKKVYEVGDIVPLRVRLEKAGRSLVQAKEILLEKTTPRVPVQELLAQFKVSGYQLKERVKVSAGKYKLDPLESKLKALSTDPRFSKQLQPMRKIFSLREGTLDCRLTEKEIVLPVLLTDPGLNTFRVTVQFDMDDLGPISRVGMASIHVGPGKPDLKRSIVTVIPVLTKQAKSVLIHATPRNAAGQLLGPGMANDFAVRLNRQKAVCKVEDQLDGAYRIELPLKKKLPLKGQRVSLTFKDKAIWEGTLKF
jgi:hypothetical protein